MLRPLFGCEPAARGGARLAVLALGWAALSLGCIGFAARPSDARLSDAAVAAGLARFEIDTLNIGGISDLAVSSAGGQRTFWLLPEQRRGVLALHANEMDRTLGANGTERAATPIWTTHPVIDNIVGIPRTLDAEAFAVLSPNRWLIGTESLVSAREADEILVVEPEGLTAKVVDSIAVPWGLWGLKARANEGIEGLCSALDTILLSGETTGLLPDGGRFAPIGRRRLADGPWAPYALRLTSATGKISALACWPAVALEPNGVATGSVAPSAPSLLEVVAIERHYGVGRVLHFFLPMDTEAGGAGHVIEPSDTFDLAAWLHPIPNYESIAWLDDDTLLLISDNAMAVQSGPTEALVVPMQNLAPVLPRTP